MQNSIGKIQKVNSKLKNIKAIYLPAFLLLFAFSFLVSRGANAQEIGRLDLTVSPPVIELTAKPGEKILEKFRVRNNLSQSIDLQISVRRLISSPTDGNPVPEEQAKGEELSWVTLDPQSFTARPSEWQDITFTIDVPENASYGYYYVFRIAPKNESSVKVTGTSIKGEILIVTLLNVKKEGASSKSELVSFNTKHKINEYLPVEFDVKLANKGNVHVKPRGNIFISRGNGKDISILEVNQNVGSILPGGTRQFTSSWNEGFLVKEKIMENDAVKLDEKGNPMTKIVFNWNKLTDFRIGPYTAQLLMVYDDGNKDVTIEGSTTFWVIPYTALAVIIISLIVLFIIIRFLLKIYIRRAIKNSHSR